MATAGAGSWSASYLPPPFWSTAKEGALVAPAMTPTSPPLHLDFRWSGSPLATPRLADLRWPAGAAVAFAAAARHGLFTIFDGGVGTPKVLLDLARRAPRAILSQPGWAQASAASYSRGLMAVWRLVPGIVGVAQCPDGFLWREGARKGRIPAPKVVAIDALAAGGVRRGAFALAQADGRAVADSGRFATAAKTITCSRAGRRLGTPHRHEVMAPLSAKGCVSRQTINCLNFNALA